MPEAQWTRAAEADLDEIYLYIAREDGRPLTAKRVEEELIERCNQQAGFSAAGHETGSAIPELGDAYRYLTHKRWIILFRSEAPTIVVLAVLDSARDDWGLVFRDRAAES